MCARALPQARCGGKSLAWAGGVRGWGGAATTRAECCADDEQVRKNWRTGKLATNGKKGSKKGQQRVSIFDVTLFFFFFFFVFFFFVFLPNANQLKCQCDTSAVDVQLAAALQLSSASLFDEDRAQTKQCQYVQKS